MYGKIYIFVSFYYKQSHPFAASTADAHEREPSLSRDEKVFPQSCHDASTQDAIDCDRANDYNIINN